MPLLLLSKLLHELVDPEGAVSSVFCVACCIASRSARSSDLPTSLPMRALRAAPTPVVTSLPRPLPTYAPATVVRHVGCAPIGAISY